QELGHPRLRRLPRSEDASQLRQRLLPPLERRPPVGLEPLHEREHLHELVVREVEALLEVAHDVGVDHLEGFVPGTFGSRSQERGRQRDAVPANHKVLPAASWARSASASSPLSSSLSPTTHSETSEQKAAGVAA